MAKESIRKEAQMKMVKPFRIYTWPVVSVHAVDAGKLTVEISYTLGRMPSFTRL